MKTKMTMAQEQDQWIRDAFVFIGIPLDHLEIKIVEEDVSVCAWAAITKEGWEVFGRHTVESEDAAHLAVISIVGLATHRHGPLMVEAMLLAEAHSYPDEQRNGLGELLVRAIAKKALTQVPARQAREYVEHILQLQLNIDEMSTRRH